MGSVNKVNVIFTKEQQSTIYLDGKWVRSHHSILDEDPSKINEIKKDLSEFMLKYFLDVFPLTKLYYKD